MKLANTFLSFKRNELFFPEPSALAVNEHWKKYMADTDNQNILRFSPGEFIFKEGHSSTSFFVIKSGSVTISIERSGQHIILEELKAGDVFGEMAALLESNRSASAVASTYTEVNAYSKLQLDRLLKSSPVAIQKLLKLQLERVTSANERASDIASLAHPLVIAAEIIELHAVASGGEKALRPGIIQVPLKPIIKSLCRMMGLSDVGARALIKKMAQFRFFTTAGKEEKRLEISDINLVQQAEKLALEVGYDVVGHYESEKEFIDLGALMGFTGATKSNILRKLATEEFADSTFIFRRSEIMELLKERGKEFFMKRTIKPIEDWNEVEDLNLVDTPSLQKALGRLEPYDLTVLMLGLPDGEIQTRLEDGLSERRREVVEDMAGDVDNFSDVDVRIILDDLFNKIRIVKGVS